MSSELGGQHVCAVRLFCCFRKEWIVCFVQIKVSEPDANHPRWMLGMLYFFSWTMILATKARICSGVNSVMPVNFLALAMKFFAFATLLRSFSSHSIKAEMASAICVFSLEYASDRRRNCSLLTRPRVLSSYILLNTVSSSASRLHMADSSRSAILISFATSPDCFCWIYSANFSR